MSLESTLGKLLNPLAPSYPNMPSKSLLPPPPKALKTPEEAAPSVTTNLAADASRKKAAEAGLSAFTVPLLKAPGAAA